MRCKERYATTQLTKGLKAAKAFNAVTRKALFKVRNKYGNKKQTADGYTFDSKAELLRYDELQLLEKCARIHDLKVHPELIVTVSGPTVKHIPVCKVILDFSYYDGPSDQVVFEDVKGRDNPLSRLKRKLVEAQYGIKVQLITKGRR